MNLFAQALYLYSPLKDRPPYHKPDLGVAPTVLADGQLKSLRVPTLCLIGEHEKLYSAQKAARRLDSVAPQIKTGIIPGAGHDLLDVQTELVVSKVLEFLK